MLLHQSPHKMDQPQTGAIWLKRLGWLGFLFFLVKGVLWLTLPILLVYFGVK